MTVAPHPIAYATNGDVSIAYMTIGEGPRDIVVVTGWVFPMDSIADCPPFARWVERLTKFGRVILWDKRGTGLSDRVPVSELPSLEERMDDLGAVMDATGAERPALLGMSEGSLLAAMFAATYPERCSELVLYGGFGKTIGDADYTAMPGPEAFERWMQRLRDTWGDPARFIHDWAPSMSDDQSMRAWWRSALQRGASPAAALAWMRMLGEMDIRAAVPSIAVPALVLHRAGDKLIPPANGRWIADHLPGAKYVELPSDDHLWFAGDLDAMIEEIEFFITGERTDAAPDRVLATVLFTDIVDSTRRTADLGDRRWRDLVERHDQITRTLIERHRGRTVNSMGDGFLAAFDGPARAVRCAWAIRDAMDAIGLPVRAGLHAGECELVGDDLRGLAVNIGARVGALAQPGEILVSRTVRDLVAGSGIEFATRGTHELKGVPGSWDLLAVESA